MSFDILPASREIVMQQMLDQRIQRAGLFPDGFVIQPQQLRIHTLLKPGTTSYNFDFKNGAITNYPMDVLLTQNDRFYAHSVGIQILKQNVTDSVQNYGTEQRFTYPDPNFFVGANGGTNLPEANALYTIYNGVVAMKSNVVEYAQKMTLERCLYVPERTYQKQASPQINDEYPEYGTTLERRGFFFMGDFVNINGQNQNSATITLAPGDTALIDGHLNNAGEAVTTRNVLCFMLEGFLVVEGAASQQKY